MCREEEKPKFRLVEGLHSQKERAVTGEVRHVREVIAQIAQVVPAT